MEGLLKARATQMIIRFAKGILRNDVRGQSNPRPAKRHDGPHVGGILVQPLAQLV